MQSPYAYASLFLASLLGPVPLRRSAGFWVQVHRVLAHGQVVFALPPPPPLGFLTLCISAFVMVCNVPALHSSCLMRDRATLQ